MGLYDDKNPCKRAIILGRAIKALEQQESCEDAVNGYGYSDNTFLVVGEERGHFMISQHGCRYRLRTKQKVRNENA